MTTEEDVKVKSNNIISDVEDFADTFYKLASLNLTQKITNVSAAAVVGIALCTAALLAAVFAGIALSWWLGNLVQSRIGGFLLGAVFFLLVMLGVYFSRKKISVLLKDLIVRKIYD